MTIDRTWKAVLGAGLVGAGCLFAAQQAKAQETCPLSLTFYGELYPGESVSDSSRFEFREVEFTAFVGSPSLDLVGVNVTDVTLDTTFAIDSAPECTGRPLVGGAVIGDSRFDDAIRRCGAFSVPESLLGAIGILGRLVSEDVCIP